MLYVYVSLVLLVLVFVYLGFVNHLMTRRYPESLKYSQLPWTNDEMRKLYDEALQSPVDVRPFLPEKQNRRYIVLGGSGLVGGWIVQHLLDRSTPANAIRILDLRSPTRPEVSQHNIKYISTDISDSTSVHDAFNAPWPRDVSSLPITVFQCVAFIDPSDRSEINLGPYLRVNVEGTKNVIAAVEEIHSSQRTGPTVLVATSSGSVALTPPTFLPVPFSLSFLRSLFTHAPPEDFIQHLPNGEPIQHHLLSPLSSFGSCYSFSKARAEYAVRNAHDPSFGLLTGCIRPSHAIYGFGVQNTNSLSYDYLRRGGSPTWMFDVLGHFVDARNASLGHLWYEDALLKEFETHTGEQADNVKAQNQTQPKKHQSPSVGGQAYAITDPNPPITYGHLYNLLSHLAHEATPIRFPRIPPVPMLVMGYIVESYSLLRLHILSTPGLGSLIGSILPAPKGDVAFLQPAVFQVATLHLIYDDERARRELGFRACVGTMRGLVDSVREWNERVDERLSKNEGLGRVGKGTALEVGVASVPAPKAV